MGKKGSPQFFSVSPFDSARFDALSKGLDVSVVSLSTVRKSEKVRIDSGYFRRDAVSLEKQVAALPSEKLGLISKTFRKGIFDIKAETYVNLGGVPFIRVGDLRSGLIDPTKLAHISDEANAAESKTALVRNDIVISKTAYPAAALVNIDRCNVSQDTIAVSLKDSAKERFAPAYVVSYLNSFVGRTLMGRLFQGNVQEHLGLREAEELDIPEFSYDFQSKIVHLYEQAVVCRDKALSSYAEAKNTLVDALDLRDWLPPEPLSYIRSSASIVAAERLDAEHFQERFYAARRALLQAGASGFLPLEALLIQITNGQTPLKHDLSQGDVLFLGSEHVRDFEVILSGRKRVELTHHVGTLRRTALSVGDVLLTIKGRVGNVALIEKLAGPTNINQDVALLRFNKRIPIWFILSYINSSFGKMAVEQLVTGAINPFFGLENVRRLEIPVLRDAQMLEIGERTRKCVQLGQDQKNKSDLMISLSKRAIELAVESGESAATGLIAQEAGDASST